MFKSQLFIKAMLVVSSIILIYTVSIYIFILPRMQHVTQKLEEKNAHEALSKVTLLAQNTYRDIENYEDLGLQQHKDELKNLVSTVVSILHVKYEQSSPEEIGLSLQKKAERLQEDINTFYARAKTKMSHEALQKALIHSIETYSTDEGHFFVYNQNAQPIINPFNLAKDTTQAQALKQALALVKKQGQGSFTYQNKELEKIIGYAFVLKPLGWVIGIEESLSKATQKRQNEVIELIARLRYGQYGYFYISSYGNIIISHPYMKNVDMSNINDIHGKPIIPPLRKLIQERGEGFYRYFWKKNDTDTKAYEKLTYVKAFPQWKMVVGAGTYIDEIQEEIDKRKKQLMEQLAQIVNTTHIGKTGYLFLFDKNGTMLINPNKALEGQNFKTMKNPTTGRFIFDELVEKASTTKELIYKWNKPEDLEHYRYDKIAWIDQIPELEWYIVSSAYLEEFDASSKGIKYFASLLALILLCVSAFFSFFFFKNILTPAINLSKHAVMGEMIATIAHQWKQPLNELGLVLQKFEFAYHRNLLNQELLERETKTAKTLIAKMADTVDTFKNFFNAKNNAVSFDIVTSIHNIIRLMEKTLKLDDIHIVTQILETHTLKSYQGEFEHVILNILMNAKDVLMHQESHEKIILITTSKTHNALMISIHDNGGGIANEIMTKIFNPHFSTKKEGAGIGLYIAKQIIHEHIGGKLSVENCHFSLQDKGYFGACFSIELKL